MITEQRSTVSQENIEEVLSSDHSRGMYGQNSSQYFSPKWLADECMEKMPSQRPSTIVDPSAGEGALLRRDDNYYYGSRFGIELDNRIERIGGVNLITSTCTKVWEVIDDLFPDTRFVCAVANPPFGRKWKIKGEFVDSTQATWDWVTSRANYGYLISSRTTIEKLGLDKHPLCFDYSTKKLSDVWPGMKDGEIGIVCWKRPQEEQWVFTNQSELHRRWQEVGKIIEDEKSAKPAFNIWLDPSGVLKTYLSVRSSIKLKLDMEQIKKLHTINDSNPLTLIAEVETRRILADFLAAGIYTIEPNAKAAIQSALDEVDKLSAPLMPLSDFELIAHVDQMDNVTCIKDCTQINGHRLNLTAGKKYPITTESYRFTETFTRKKVHFNELTGETYQKDHDCILSGVDKMIKMRDDFGIVVNFMDRPRKNKNNEFEESVFWEYFEKPVVNTIAETNSAQIQQNMAILKALEMAAGYEYFKTKDGGGQMGYLARVACKDHALIAAETGAGKTLLAISLIAMKSPKRALIVAPQGAIRASKNEDDEDEEEEQGMAVSQWHAELNRFSPYLQVFEIFSYEDYLRIKALNGGELPEGAVYLTYWQALFSTGGKEKLPESWDDFKFNKWAKSIGLAELPIEAREGGSVINKRFHCDSVGKEVNGIRCIVYPCMSTLISHDFDMVLLDESHISKNSQSIVGAMMIRMQPKYRYAFSATPIVNTVIDIFSVMGWLSVDGWYLGKRLNAAFPYAREDLNRFTSTFLSMERDMTQEEDNRKRAAKEGKSWSGTCTRESPIISSPARLLKILKPTLAYIGKAQCSDTYVAPSIKDVRVPLGREQATLYAHFLDRANVPASNPLVRARKQSAWLRGICADPAGFGHGGPKVYSNSNPKLMAILSLVKEIIERGETVVVINSRIGLTSSIHDKLSECGITVARIDSTVSAEQHSHQANLFKKGKASVALMGIKLAAAHSFDKCSNLIVGSLEFTSGSWQQAIGRIDRVTSKHVKNIYCVLHRNSLEEMMWDCVATKGDAATICLQGKRVPREFKPVDASSVLASAIEGFTLDGSVPESEVEKSWPRLRAQMQKAFEENVKK